MHITTGMLGPEKTQPVRQKMACPDYQVGKIDQVFEAEDGLVYRLWIKNRPLISLDEIDALDRHGCSVLKRAVFLDASEDAPTRRLSLLVEPNCHALKVTRSKKKVAALGKLDYHRLAFARDFRMVNPAIDGRYQEWVDSHPTSGDCRQEDLAVQPLISVIVPLFNTPIPYLHDMLDSVMAQTYRNWELVLVNASPDDKLMSRALAEYTDSRIRHVSVEKNLGIAGNTNIGIKAATGDYIAFFDHDDVLDENALLEYAATINNDPEVDLIYCDEDNFEEDVNKSHSPLLKPDFNLDLLYSHNYVVHMLTVSRRVIDTVELSPDYVSGAQDYDMTLKAYEVARSIRHIPKVLYHWRIHPGSTNGGVMDSKPYAIEAGRRALEDHFSRRGLGCAISASNYINCVYDIHYNGFSSEDTALIVPFADERNLAAIIDGVRTVSTTKSLSVIAVGPTVKTRNPSTAYITWNAPFNFSGMLSLALKQTTAPRVVVCSEFVRFDDENCIPQLCSILSRPEVGISAAKLFYADGLVEHAGMAVSSSGVPVALNQNFTRRMGGGYLGLSECSCDYPAVGPNCFAMRREELLEALTHLKGDEDATSAIESVCQTIGEKGKLACVNPLASARILMGDIEASRTTVPELSFVSTLTNPAVNYDSGYPQLDVPRNERAEYSRFMRGLFMNKLRRR